MSNTTYTSGAYKPAATSPLGTLLREIFQATPLYIVATAVKSAFAKR